MTTIKLKVIDKKLVIEEWPVITSNSVETVMASVTLDENWNNYSLSLVFRNSSDRSSKIEQILDENNSCVVPHEVLSPGWLEIGLLGLYTSQVNPSTWVHGRVREGAEQGNETAKEPTPNVYQQLLDLINSGGNVGGGSNITVDSELSDTSTNPVQNKVVTQAIGDVKTTVGNIDSLLSTI